MASMLSKIDPSTLGWVKAEIDETIKQSYESLQRYNQNPSDTTPLRQLINQIHQVNGTLQMVELDGAAMLGQEVETLADRILSRQTNNTDAVLTSLDRGIDALTEHLNRLVKGQPDLPIRLVPVINDIRQSFNGELIEAFDLFEPDLNVSPPDRDEAELIAGPDQAHEFRRQYQNALLKWLRDENSEALSTLFQTVVELFRGARFEAVAKLWWIASAYMELLRQQLESANNEQKRIVGQLDQQIRKLVDEGESLLVREFPETLLKKMLFEVGSTGESGEYIDAIKSAFELDIMLKGDGSQEELSIDLPSLEQLQNFGEKSANTIAKAQKLLSDYFEEQQQDEEKISELLSVLQELRDVSEQGGIGLLAQLAEELGSLTLALNERQINNTAHASLQMAGALLFIENSGSGAYEPSSEWKLQGEATIRGLKSIRHNEPGTLGIDGMEVSEASLTRAEFKQLLAVVAAEIRTNLSEVEQALETFSNNQQDFEVLETVPRSLAQVQGALQTLGQSRVSELVSLVTRCINDVYENRLALQDAMMDALAVAVTSIQAYVDGLEQDSTNLSELIQKALDELELALGDLRLQQIEPLALAERIQQDLDAWLADNANQKAFMDLRQSLRDMVSLGDVLDEQQLGEIAGEMNNLLDIVSEDSAFLSDEVIEMLRRSSEHLSSLVKKAIEEEETAAETVTPDTVLNALEHGYEAEAEPADDVEMDDVQAEVLEIFMEEAEELLPEIQQGLDTWRNSGLESGDLRDLRRRFHTLKGSGRLAGVGHVSELAWAAEHLLNQVLDGILEDSEELQRFVADATEQIRKFVAGKGRPVAGFELEAWQARAETIENPSATITLDDEVAVVAATDSQPMLEPESEPEPDPEPETEPDPETELEPEMEDLHALIQSSAESEAREQLSVVETPPEDEGEHSDAVVIVDEFSDAEQQAAVETLDRVNDAVDETPADKLALDPTVLQIFTSEVRDHLQTLDKAIDEQHQPVAGRISKDLTRASHTLRGCSRSIGYVTMSEACLQFDQLLHKIIESKGELQLEDYRLMERLHDTIERSVELLQVDRDYPESLNEPYHQLTKDLSQREEDYQPQPASSGDVIAGEPRDIRGFTVRVNPAATAAPAKSADIKIFDKTRGEIAESESTQTLSTTAEPTEIEPSVVETSAVDSLVAESTAAESTEAESTEAESTVAESTVAESTVADYRIRSDSQPVPAVEFDDDELTLDLQEIFREEAIDILSRINQSLNQARREGTSEQSLGVLRRELHTLKGSARAAAMTLIGDLSHNTESILEKNIETLISDPRLVDLLEEVHDTLVELAENSRDERIAGLGEALNQRVLHHYDKPALVESDNDRKAEMDSAEASPILPVEIEDDNSELAEAIAHSEELMDQADQAFEDFERVIPDEEPDDSAEADAEEITRPAPVEAPDTADIEHPERKHFRDKPDSPATTSELPGNPQSSGEFSRVNFEAEIPPPEVSRVKPISKAVSQDISTGVSGEAGGHVRVATNVLENLSNYAGEVNITRSRLEQQVRSARGNLDELRINVRRFRDQLRDLEIEAEAQIQARPAGAVGSDFGEEFDPLEFDRFSKLQQISRVLSESLDDLVTIHAGLDEFANEAEAVLQEQGHLNVELQDGLLRTRMVAFSTYVPRLRHTVRQVSREIGKRARLVVTGEEVEIDRNVLEQLSGSFEHMIRNALDHGIESVRERQQLGKPDTGTITIHCRQEGGEIYIEFSDDGRGLDLEVIRRKALRAGMITEDTRLTDEEIIHLLVVTGFSTAERLTQLSGRGVGMDVVNDSVRKLGGGLTGSTESGKGTTFVLRLPLTLAMTQALMVKASDQTFAIPLRMIVNILKIDRNAQGGITDRDDGLFEHDGKLYSVVDLTLCLGLNKLPYEEKKQSVLLIRMGNREVALIVDRLLGTQEVVVKNVGAQIASIDGISGASILPDGSVALILDVAELWLEQLKPAKAKVESPDRELKLTLAPDRSDQAAARHEPQETTVLVIDDSLTVRKITARNLRKSGMEVKLAKDGVDALEKLREGLPDVMLVDIEMPRMDGFELISRIKDDEKTADIPIIVITSRSGSRHKQKAESLGADVYLTKPYQLDDLLSNIRLLVNKP